MIRFFPSHKTHTDKKLRNRIECRATINFGLVAVFFGVNSFRVAKLISMFHKCVSFWVCVKFLCMSLFLSQSIDKYTISCNALCLLMNLLWIDVSGSCQSFGKYTNVLLFLELYQPEEGKKSRNRYSTFQSKPKQNRPTWNECEKKPLQRLRIHSNFDECIELVFTTVVFPFVMVIFFSFLEAYVGNITTVLMSHDPNAWIFPFIPSTMCHVLLQLLFAISQLELIHQVIAMRT